MSARLILLLLLAALTLAGRENPFKPVIDETVLPLTSNTVKRPPPFRQTTIKLPSDARVLTSVAIYYQALDGSIKKEIVAVDRAIDWHKPLVLSQAGGPATNGSRSPKKRSTAKPSTRPHPAAKPLTYRPLPFLTLRFKENEVFLKTNDPKIRTFHLAKPFKVVFDFRRNASFLSRHRTLRRPPFKAVDIGNHAGYYRVVITLDAPYRYTVTKRADGYLLKLR